MSLCVKARHHLTIDATGIFKKCHRSVKHMITRHSPFYKSSLECEGKDPSPMNANLPMNVNSETELPLQVNKQNFCEYHGFTLQNHRLTHQHIRRNEWWIRCLKRMIMFLTSREALVGIYTPTSSHFLAPLVIQQSSQ